MNVDSRTRQDHVPPNAHLKGLRDLLDLPFSTLQGDVLTFVLGEKYQVLGRCIGAQHLSLVCEVCRIDALSAPQWQALLAYLTSAYDYSFPVSALAIDGHVALLWRCDADVSVDRWLRWAEDALTFALDIRARVEANAL